MDINFRRAVIEDIYKLIEVQNRSFYEKLGYIKVGEYRHSEILTMFKYAKEIE